jgi:hypothetical protein
MNGITSTSLAVEKEHKEIETKTGLERSNDLKEWFIRLKNELLNIEFSENEKIPTEKITQRIKFEFENYIDNIFRSKSRSCEIYKKRIGLIPIENNTLECIAEPYGITRERVRQILLKSSRRVVHGKSYNRLVFLEIIKSIFEEIELVTLYNVFVFDFINLFNEKFADDITTCIFGSGAFKEFASKNNNYIVQQRKTEVCDKKILKQDKFEKTLFFPSGKKQYLSSIKIKPSLREVDTKNGGTVFLTKSGKTIQYQSKMELAVLEFLESHPKISEINSQCIKIPYIYLEQLRTYYPDFVIKTTDNCICIIEVMTFYQMPQHQNLCKFKALHKFCEENKMGYAIIDERMNSIFDFHECSYDYQKAKILIDACNKSFQLNKYEYENLLIENNISIKKLELATIAFKEDLNLTFYPFKITLGESLRKKEESFKFLSQNK